MSKYAHIEQTTNKVLGWYDDSIHSTIPAPNVEVELGVWKEAITINANFYEDGKFIDKDFRTPEELVEIAVKEIETSIQSMLDNQAKELGYDSIVSACSYAGYPNDFQVEAIALGTWRSAVWSKAYELQATMVEIPTVEEILIQLPKYGEEI